MNILIKNINAICNNDIQIVNIITKDDLIYDILPIDQLPSNFKIDKTIDGSNKLAVPGFINTHTHAAMTLLRGYADDMLLMDWLQNKVWPAEAKLIREDVYWGSKLAIAEMIQSGTTCFADMYFFMDETAKAVEETGIRADLSRGITGFGPDSDDKLAEAVKFATQWQGKAQGRITTRLGPHAPYTCPPAFIKKVVEVAKIGGHKIHIHLSETKEEVDTCIQKFGMTPIEHMNNLGLFDLPTLAAHCVHINDNDLSIIKSKNVTIAHNPQSNLKLASGIAPLKNIIKYNIPVGLGTDSATSNNNLDMLEEIRLAALLHKNNEFDPLFLPAPQALSLACQGGAQALNLPQLGVLQKGYKADIVLFDTTAPVWHPQHNIISTLVYSAPSSSVHTVIVNGQILLENKEFKTIDIEKTIFEANKAAKQLVK